MIDAEMELSKVYKLIFRLSLQVPSTHRRDSHRIYFLLREVIGYYWSREWLYIVVTNFLQFQHLYG